MSVPVRPAATVMVVRDDHRGRLETLLLRRQPDSGFVPGAHVFPGGAVDPADSALPLAATRGLDDRTASERLGVDAGGLAYWVAAVREAFEEAGVLFAASDDGVDPWADEGRAARLHRARVDLDDGTITLADLCAAEGLLADLGALRSFGRWITPLGAPRRYDTRFFVAPMPSGPAATEDGREVVHAEWVRPPDALERFAAGDIDLILPTERSLVALADHDETASLLAWLDTHPPEIDDHGGWRAAPERLQETHPA
ncbi:MAG: hypothetical protein AAGK32_04935 [Actinomycetota bacterium]